ncbi:hypothetical protein EDD92_8552 [Streptomyces sp. TLI_185]|nr:hypothetical protein EDD92_8552 [Streptomyces sp. TLI_185]
MSEQLETLPYRHVLTLPAEPSAVRLARETAEQALVEWGIGVRHPAVDPALLILCRAGHQQRPARGRCLPDGDRDPCGGPGRRQHQRAAKGAARRCAGESDHGVEGVTVVRCVASRASQRRAYASADSVAPICSASLAGPPGPPKGRTRIPFSTATLTVVENDTAGFGRLPSSGADSVWGVPHARMGHMCLMSGWMRCAEARSAGPCCWSGEGTAG